MLINPLMQGKGGGRLSNGVILWSDYANTVKMGTVNLSQPLSRFSYIGLRYRSFTTQNIYGEVIMPIEDFLKTSNNESTRLLMGAFGVSSLVYQSVKYVNDNQVQIEGSSYGYGPILEEIKGY